MTTTRQGCRVRWMLKLDIPEVLAIGQMRRADLIRDMQTRNRIGMVAERDGRVVGFMVYDLYNRRLHVVDFSVAADCRRQCVGTAMAAKLASKIGRKRSEITVDVWEGNLAAQLFWRAMGYEAVKVLREHYSDGDDAYRMRYTGAGV